MHIEPGQKPLKTRLRKELRQKRAAIDADLRVQWDALINQHLEAFATQHRWSLVAAYMAFDGEPDLLPVLSNLGQKGVKLALPVIQDAPAETHISMRAWSLGQDMVANHYGIAEPGGTEDIRLSDIDLVLVPLVGWDRAGGRLGMGAGYYDRLFQPCAGAAKPMRIGVGYEIQCLPEVPRDPWDIRLHGVITENGWHHCDARE